MNNFIKVLSVIPSNYFTNYKNQRYKDLETIKKCNYDTVVIGGGCTGSGIGLDSASRGLNTLLLEKNDFTSGTSSKSTKLIHGGVRYLEKAVLNLDINQYNLVKEALYEREIFMNNAKYITKPINLLVPCNSYYELFKTWIGLKLYDFISYTRLDKSYYLNKNSIKDNFPYLLTNNLKGGIIYSDGQHNDVRTNMAIIKTAESYGCKALNHIEVIDLIKNKNNKIIGIVAYDNIIKEKIQIKCKHVINATGPYADIIRKIDDNNCSNLIYASNGTHIIYKNTLNMTDTGILIPKTDDGRVLFILPWYNNILVGTTDDPCSVSFNPKPNQNDLQYITDQMKKYIDDKTLVQTSIWSGIRPLVKTMNNNSENIIRSHYLEITKSGLISITGGKWTIYRKMAEDSVNIITDNKCITNNLPLIGNNNYNNKLCKELKTKYNMEEDIIEHLVNRYGNIAIQILEYNNNIRISKDLPYIKSEILYLLDNEYISSVDDLINRLNLNLIDIIK